MVFESISDCFAWTRFPGGITQQDWWTLPTYSIQAYFAGAIYNQGAYANTIHWNQAQQYQKKNYNLAWVSVAREDIRQFMSIFVSRLSNYMVVATLIVNLAAASLFWV